MPTSVGPNTFGEENLVFGYDLGDVSNSYRGEPTVNLVTNDNTRTFDNGSDGNWSYQTVAGSGSIGIDNPKSGTHSAKLTRSGGGGGEVNYWWNAGPGLSLTPGVTYTFSMDVWCDKPGMAKLFSYLAGTNGSSDYHPGDSTWRRLSMQFIPAVSTSAAQIRFGLLTANSNYPVTAYFDNAQVEQNAHATQFTAGTRSATQGLQDLTGNSTLDLTNVSFDSDAQMTFDGTDDWMNAVVTLNAGNFTYETVMKQFGSTSHRIFTAGTGDPSNGGTNIQAFVNSSGGLVNLYAPVGGSGWQWGTYDNTGNFTATSNVNYHIAVVNLGTTWKIYVNGDLVGDIDSFVPTVGNRVGIARTAMQAANDSSSQVSLVKIYDKALTASEIKSNYNAIKGRFNI